MEKCKKYIAEVLRHIEDNHLMPPLMVIQTLADSQYATLDDIKVRLLGSLDCVRMELVYVLVYDKLYNVCVCYVCVYVYVRFA